MDLASIQDKAKTNSNRDANEIKDPLLSPTLENTFKSKKSKFAQMIENDPLGGSPSSKFALMQKEPLPTKQFKADRNGNRARNDLITDISFLDYTDLDLLSVKNATTNYLLIQNRNELYRYIWAMFCNTQIIEAYKISPFKFSNFITEVDKYYSKNNNPFHNFQHGLTVMSTAYNIFKISNLNKYFSQTGVTSLLFAGLMHDIEHTGRNNMFEINRSGKLSVRYNDDSVLENHHSARAFQIISQKDFNIFENMHQNNFPSFRKFVIRSILSTDIKKHFTELAIFKDKLDNGDLNPFENSENQDDFLLMIGIFIHCCDLYTPTLSVESSFMWSHRVNQEFQMQSKHEAELGLPLTPFLIGLDDIKKVANSEKFFIKSIVKPLWLEMDRFLQGVLSERLKNIETNLNTWEMVLNNQITVNEGMIEPVQSSKIKPEEEENDQQL